MYTDKATCVLVLQQCLVCPIRAPVETETGSDQLK